MDRDVSLYYNQMSYFSQKARLCVAEKGIDCKEVAVSLHTGETYEPWYMRINPLGQVPVLQHGKKFIPDSRKIAEYLDGNFAGPKLIPDLFDEKGGNKVREICDLCLTVRIEIITFGFLQNPDLQHDTEIPPFMVKKMTKKPKKDRRILFQEHAEKYPDLSDVYLAKANVMAQKAKPKTREEVEEALDVARKVLDVAEQQLHDNAKAGHADYWLCCPDFTLADIEIAIMLRRTKFVGAAKSTWLDSKHPQLEKYYQKLIQRKSFKKICVDPFTTMALVQYAVMMATKNIPVKLLLVSALVMGATAYYMMK